MTIPPTLEQIARDAAEQCASIANMVFAENVRFTDGTALRGIILRALQTATKQPQGADWAVEVARLSALASGWEGKAKRNYGLRDFALTPADRRARYETIANTYSDCAKELRAVIAILLPLVANREDSERDSKRLDWCEAKDAMPEYDDNGFWKVRYSGLWFTGNTARQAIDAAMRPAQPERGQGEGTT